MAVVGFDISAERLQEPGLERVLAIAVEADAERAPTLQIIAQGSSPVRVALMGAAVVVVEVVVQHNAARFRVDTVYVQEAGRLPRGPTRSVLHQDGRLVHGSVQRVVTLRVDEEGALLLQVEKVLKAVRARHVVRALEDVPQPLIVESKLPELGRDLGVGKEGV